MDDLEARRITVDGPSVRNVIDTLLKANEALKREVLAARGLFDTASNCRTATSEIVALWIELADKTEYDQIRKQNEENGI